MRRVLVVVTVTMLAAMPACADLDSASDGDSPPTTPEVASTSSTIEATTPAADTTADAPEPEGTPEEDDSESATSGKEDKTVLTGFGASREAWDAHHDQAPGYSEGAAYLPMVTEDQPKYAAVCCGGQITLYVMYLPPDTTVEGAQRAVAAELPDDATPGELIDKGECLMQVWESPTLSEIVGMNALASYFLDGYELPDVTMSAADSADDYEC